MMLTVNLASCWQSYRMPSYRGYRFPPDIISHAVWLYHRAPQQAVGKMTEGPSKSAVRSRLQTTPAAVMKSGGRERENGGAKIDHRSAVRVA